MIWPDAPAASGRRRISAAVACHDVDPGLSCRIRDHGIDDVMRARESQQLDG
jgi:hypothetical protein